MSYVIDVPRLALDLLPKPAREKLERAGALRSAAHDAYRGASDREREARANLNQIRNTLGALGRLPATQEVPSISFPNVGKISKDPQDEDKGQNQVIRDPALRQAEEALAVVVAAKSAAADNQSRYAYLETVEDWLKRVNRSGGPFKLSKAIRVDAKDPLRALAKVREGIDLKASEFEQVERAPLPSADLLLAAYAEIDEFTNAGAISVNSRARGGSPLRLRESARTSLYNGTHLLGNFGTDTLAYLLKDRLKAEAESLIGQLDDSEALSDADRAERLARLTADRLALEREEEALIVAAEQEGRAVDRRIDLDPRAFLGIED